MFNRLRSLHILITLLLAGSTLVSCFKDEEIDYSQYNDLVITNVAFGTLPRIMHTKSKAGQDSTYNSSVSATSVYPFSIDHVNNRIFNLDSLPVGVKADKIIFSTFTVNGGQAALQKLTSKEDTVYNVKDTLDFSHGPRIFHLFGNDGTSRREYQIEVRIHQQTLDSLTWRHYDVSDPAAANPFPATTTAHLGSAFTTAGHTFRVEEGKISVSTDGETFADDAIETDNVAQLPTADFAWISSPARGVKDVEEVLLYGTIAEADTLAGRIWRRNVDLSGNLSTQWEYLPATFEVFHPVPGLHDASIFHYDKGYLLVGLNNKDQIIMKYSLDRGRTWKNHDQFKFPADLKAKTAKQLRSTVDEDSNLWLLLDEQEVWYGRAHSVGWAEDPRKFVE